MTPRAPLFFLQVSESVTQVVHVVWGGEEKLVALDRFLETVHEQDCLNMRRARAYGDRCQASVHARRSYI